MEPFVLNSDIEDRLQDLGGADILIGVPSFNNARTIGHVVKAVQAGLAKYFPNKKALLVNSDGGSTDGTMEVVQNTSIEDFNTMLLQHQLSRFVKVSTAYRGVPGKGSAFRTIFEIARRVSAEACAVVDSDLRSITPEWVELLIRPILEGFDYVAPLYHRHKYDGTITNSIVYPLTRALYGKRVRQPIGGDFGFSGSLAQFYLGKDVWETDVAKYGIDIWMTTTAIANGFKVCQAFLGAKIHDPKDPGSDLSSMLYQVVGATFDLMEEYPDKWRATEFTESVPTFGFQYAVGLEPVQVNVDRMIDRFRLGVKELSDLWRSVLPEEIIAYLHGLVTRERQDFHLPDVMWVELVYRFAIAAHRKALNKEHLLKSLTPLYIGRTASFVLDTAESSAADVEEKIEGLCREFEQGKSSLLANNWDV